MSKLITKTWSSINMETTDAIADALAEAGFIGIKFSSVPDPRGTGPDQYHVRLDIDEMQADTVEEIAAPHLSPTFVFNGRIDDAADRINALTADGFKVTKLEALGKTRIRISYQNK